MSLHINTPRMSVFEPRGLSVRTVDYCRVIEDGPVEPRINRTLHDPAGHAVKQWDPRLWLSQVGDPLTPANLTQAFSLDATVIRSDSVDAGTQIELKGLAAQTMFSWDSRQTRREIEYDNLLRPVAIFEEGTGELRRCVERLTYGHPDSGDQSRNQFGQLIRHDHPAGSVLFTAFAISGPCTEDTRHFTLDPLTPDWPEQEADRLRLLEPGVGATSRWRHGALGDVLEQTDARDNRHTFTLTVDGRLRERRLQLKGEPEQILMTDIRYNAQGNVTRQTAGNRVHTTRTYRPEDDRLLGLRSEDAHGLVLQHLSYEYDRMGNVLSIEDKALPIRYFSNQRIDPASRFVYDSLDQLIMAFGWEAGSASQGPQSTGRVDPAAVSNYQQIYEYDPGGNLRNLIHVGPQSHGRKLQPTSYSNRSLPYEDVPPGDPEIEAAYDRRGNLLLLEPGRMLSWNLRNQLQSVSPVERTSGLNDQEIYLYDGSRQRVRKIRSSLTSARTLVADVRYLPGLELRTDNGTGERLQVITAEDELNSIRVLHWASPPPSGINNRYRYAGSDHLGSVSLETADDGAVISRETFHPFGTSARQDGEFSYKFVRYSGKERDASGLDYYGYRYYIPWLQKWSNPDPAGEVDGLDLYRMVRNNPMTFFDEQGEVSKSDSASGIFDLYKASYSATDRTFPYRMMSEITQNKLKFLTTRATAQVLEKTKSQRFSLRHYSSYGDSGDAPPFKTIESNFSLVKNNVMTLGGKGGNTSEKDWTKAGNMGFTFFLLAINGEVNERAFLKTKTHFAEYDLDDDTVLEAAFGKGFSNLEIFASPDVLDPKHSADMGKVPMVKGTLMDMKALLLGNSGISPVQVGRMDSRALLDKIDHAFGGSLEIKVPGTINVSHWQKKSTAAIRKAA
ncbi:toxin [Pseudomonas fluorescens]|uniref:Toxin n=1 Tax=Pseudomonas fluorescens TaxID=294 RepID=A0A345USB1_PSEFL|nr:RHS repeat-associated core domain-containing protein [Pseudomonas fluorescens]AXJ03363.1 toxin [Pseudomonas fluorescens]WJK10908.1 RHS repeat-associated core domain-containing protein [Pseudomonas fluorescens]